MKTARFRRTFPLMIGWFALASIAFPATPKIGVLLKGKSGFWDATEKGAREAGEKFGAELIIKSPPNETDVAIQVRLLHALAGEGIQALVISPSNKKSLAAPVAALAAEGVKIVVIDTQLEASIPSVFVGTDQQGAGEAAGALLASLVGANDEVSFLKHDQSGGATQQREDGALKKLRETYPQIVVHGDVYASTEAGMEEDRARFLLSKYPATKAIFASGTPDTMAMLRVLTQRKSGGHIEFIGCGFNLNPTVVAALQSGVLTGWIAQLPKEMGFNAVEAAVKLINGQPVPPEILTNFMAVTKSNLSDPKVQALLSL